MLAAADRSVTGDAWASARALTVVRGGAIGDFVVALPALRALAAGGRRLRLVGNRAAALGLAPELFERVDSTDDPAWTGLFADELPLPVDGDAAVVLLKDAAVGVRLDAAGAAPILSARPFPEPSSPLHVADYLLGAVAPACSERPVAPAIPAIAPSAEERARARQRLRQAGVGGAYAVLHPGSGSPRKNWPLERFARVADRLTSAGLSIVVTTGPADAGVVAGLSRLVGAPVVRLDELPLAGLAGLLADAALYVGNDSGPSHVAAAVGSPTVAIFGPTRASRWAPRGPSAIAVEPPHRCPACSAAEERPVDCACLLTVTIDDVLASIARVAPGLDR
jgi:ADP-heptose:LPS heptosyltransferase